MSVITLSVSVGMDSSLLNSGGMGYLRNSVMTSSRWSMICYSEL